MIAGSQTDRERGNAPDREQDNEQQLHPGKRVELSLLRVLLVCPLIRLWRPGRGQQRTRPVPGGLETENWGMACLTGS